MMGIEKHRVDPLTTEKFIAKRANQVFACAQNRIRFNNAKQAEHNKRMAPFEKPQRKNLRILANLLKTEKEKIIHIEFLRGAGFDFSRIHGSDVNDTKYMFQVENFLWGRCYDENGNGTDNIKIVRI